MQRHGGKFLFSSSLVYFFCMSIYLFIIYLLYFLGIVSPPYRTGHMMTYWHYEEFARVYFVPQSQVAVKFVKEVFVSQIDFIVKIVFVFKEVFVSQIDFVVKIVFVFKEVFVSQIDFVVKIVFIFKIVFEIVVLVATWLEEQNKLFQVLCSATKSSYYLF